MYEEGMTGAVSDPIHPSVFPHNPSINNNMIKAGNLSRILKSATTDILSKGLITNTTTTPLTILLVTSEGHLVASSTPINDSAEYEACQRIAAVSASVAVEYRAIERLELPNVFKCFTMSTPDRVIRTSHFAGLMDGSVLLIVSIGVSGAERQLEAIGLARAIAARLEEDLLPSLAPVLDNMISAPPTE